MRGLLTLLLVAAMTTACSSDTADPPTTPSPSPGASRLAIAPQPDFLIVGASLALEARLTEGTSAPRVVAADWSSTDGRVAVVDRSGRLTAVAAGSTTIGAVFSEQTATLAVRVAPDFAGTWTGARRVTTCVHPRPDFCAASYPTNSVVTTSLVLTQARDRVSGTLRFSPPPLPSPSAAVTGTISETGRLTLDGTIVSTPASGATTTLGTLADWRTEIDPPTGVMRGSFVEARTDADGTAWRVSWDFQGLTRTR